MRHGFPPLCITPSLRSVYYDALNIVSVLNELVLIPFSLSRTIILLYSGVSRFSHVLSTSVLFCGFFDCLVISRYTTSLLLVPTLANADLL